MIEAVNLRLGGDAGLGAGLSHSTVNVIDGTGCPCFFFFFTMFNVRVWGPL
jgi:hypothetical protein